MIAYSKRVCHGTQETEDSVELPRKRERITGKLQWTTTEKSRISNTAGYFETRGCPSSLERREMNSHRAKRKRERERERKMLHCPLNSSNSRYTTPTLTKSMGKFTWDLRKFVPGKKENPDRDEERVVCNFRSTREKQKRITGASEKHRLFKWLRYILWLNVCLHSR